MVVEADKHVMSSAAQIGQYSDDCNAVHNCTKKCPEAMVNSSLDRDSMQQTKSKWFTDKFFTTHNLHGVSVKL